MSPTYRLWSFRLSPYAGKVRVVLAEKGLEAEVLDVHPARRPPRLRELNPVGRVPVLEAGGVALRESAVICDFLEEAHPEPPLWPRDPVERAAGRGWVRYLDDEVTLPLFLGMRKASFGSAPGDPEDVVERLHSKLARRWPVLEAALGEHRGPWLLGEALSLADLAALPVAVRLPEWTPHLAPDPDDFPRLGAWLEALRARPSAAAVDARGTRVEA